VKSRLALLLLPLVAAAAVWLLLHSRSQRQTESLRRATRDLHAAVADGDLEVVCAATSAVRAPLLAWHASGHYVRRARDTADGLAGRVLTLCLGPRDEFTRQKILDGADSLADNLQALDVTPASDYALAVLAVLALAAVVTAPLVLVSRRRAPRPIEEATRD
jgi:hypothetical protein